MCRVWCMTCLLNRQQRLNGNSMMNYPIIHVESAQIIDDEQLGSKTKFWFERNDEKWLFKEARVIQHPTGDVVTGEDWTEKVAAEIAQVIGFRAAKVELAYYQGRRGSASLSFITDHNLHLEHGNEILAGHLLNYDQSKKQHQSEHTLHNIIRALLLMFPNEQDSSYILTQLADYLVLDALIANTDRHHENWGLFWRTVMYSKVPSIPSLKSYDVAPSFDHASSLGRELLDAKKDVIIKNKTINQYLDKGRGGIYWHETDPHGISPILLVEQSAIKYPSYFKPALEKLSQISLSRINATLDDVPADRASDISKNFAKLLLENTYQRLIRLLT